MSLIIREATAEDVEIFNDFGVKDQEINDVLESETDWAFLVFDDSKTVAYACCEGYGEEMTLFMEFHSYDSTLPEYGKAIINYMLDFAKQKGFKRITVDTDNDEDVAIYDLCTQYPDVEVEDNEVFLTVIFDLDVVEPID